MAELLNELSDEELNRRSKFNSRVLPWHTIQIFRTADEVETWRKYGTPFLLMITHGGKANTAGC